MANLLSEEDELRRFNAAQSDQPWYARALPMEGRATILPFRDTMPGSVFNKREFALPGLLAEAVNAFTSPARSLLGTDPEFNPQKEAANMALNTFGGGIVTGKALRNPTGVGGTDLALNVYHGTPHEIKGGFDISKVGTGEGAQAYGHGMYFAGNPAVAEVYQSAVNPVARSAQMMLQSVDNNINKAIKLAQTEVKRIEPHKDAPYLVEGTYQKAVDSLNYLQQLKKGNPPPVGNLYKADIPDAAIPMMLDWDKPLNQQSGSVKEALSKIGIKVDEKAYKTYLDDLEAQLLGSESKNTKYVSVPSGQEIYQKLVNKYGSPEIASQELNKIGITGIKYLDQGSRGTPQNWVVNWPNFGGYDFPSLKEAQAFIKSHPKENLQLIEPKPTTSNYVVFDPSTVKILEKNGIKVKDLIEKGLLGE